MLDTDLIVQRRHELGLSQRHVARQLGVSPMTLVALESGTNHDDLPLRLLARLADVLACDIGSLLEQPAHDNGCRGDEDAVAEVGALLASAGDATAVETVAESTGSTLARTDELLAELDQRLRRCGLRLDRAPAGVQLVADPAHRQPAAFEQLLRGQHARRGLTITEAKLLHRALTGTLEPRSLANSEKVAYARLLNARLVATLGHVEADVRTSLPGR